MADLFALTEPTADRVRRALLDPRDLGAMPRKWPEPARVALVRCLSETPAGDPLTGGVAAQCYAASALLWDADQIEPGAGEDVWLTVWGWAGASVPVLGKPYLCVLAGDITLSDGIPKRRALAAADCCEPRGSIPASGSGPGGCPPCPGMPDTLYVMRRGGCPDEPGYGGVGDTSPFIITGIASAGTWGGSGGCGYSTPPGPPTENSICITGFALRCVGGALMVDVSRTLLRSDGTFAYSDWTALPVTVTNCSRFCGYVAVPPDAVCGDGTSYSISAASTGCVGASYDCVSGDCIDPGDGTGVYPTLAACIDAGCGAGGCTGHIFTLSGCCAGVCWPGALTVTVSGPCADLNGTYALNFDPLTGWRWLSAAFNYGGDSCRWQFACGGVDGARKLELALYRISDNTLIVGATCHTPDCATPSATFDTVTPISPGGPCAGEIPALSISP